jgi:Mn2+/Fe2+ NRAMP family transporter
MGATVYSSCHKCPRLRQRRPTHLRETASDGDAAGLLFMVGIIAVGLLAVPIMTTGAAYDLCQVLGWKSSLHSKPKDAGKFYGLIVAFTIIAVAMNFLGFNPMEALVYSGSFKAFLRLHCCCSSC